MKKIFILIVLLLVIYILLRIGYRFYGDGHDYIYTIETEQLSFEIKETFVNDEKNSNYYFKIKNKDQIFYYQTFENFRNKSKIIEDIYYYEDDKYQCILPIYTGKRIISDILCKTSSDYFYFYHHLKGINKKLDEFALSMSKKGYNVENWSDNSKTVEKDNIKSHYENIPGNHFVALTNYKGLIVTNGKEKSLNYIPLFNSDIYQKKFNILYQNKYIVADYNLKYRFHEFYVLDIITGKKDKIISDYELSFDSYVQGIIENEIYFFDKDSKKQFVIDMDKRIVKEVGNENIGVKVYNGVSWENISAITASNQEIVFGDLDDYNIENDKYVKVEKYGKEKYGYYYYYKKVENKYLIYRSNIQDNNQLIYLFSTSDLENIKFFHQDIYFIDDEYIKKYSDKNGIRKVLEYKELKYNDNLYFDVYINS